MKIKLQTEALARVEGLEIIDFHGTPVFDHPKQGLMALPDYDSHDSLQRIIDGLSEEELKLYDATLISLVVDCFHVHKATPAQKRIAILKALGLWEEGE